MTSPITAMSTAASTATPPTGIIGTDGTTNTNNTQTDATTDNIEDDKDLFLKLLVAQMKNQDPDNPTDSSQYLSQMASFTEVEKLGDIADAQTSQLAASQMSTAVSMLGDTVSYGAGDSASSGKVTGVTVIDGVPQLLLGTTKVQLTDVTGVAPAGATAIAPNSGTDSSGSATSGSASSGTSSGTSAAAAAAQESAIQASEVSNALNATSLGGSGSNSTSSDTSSPDYDSLASLYGAYT